MTELEKIEYIKKVVFKFYNIPLSFCDNKTRKREIVLARQVTMYFCTKIVRLNYITIGDNVGNKDHATISHAKKTVNNLLDTDKYFQSCIAQIEKLLHNNGNLWRSIESVMYDISRIINRRFWRNNIIVSKDVYLDK